MIQNKGKSNKIFVRLYTEEYKTSLRDVKEDLNKCRDRYPIFMN